MEVWLCGVVDERGEEGKEGAYGGNAGLERCFEVGDGLVVLVVVFIALIVVVFNVFVFEGGSYVVVVFLF